MALNQIIELVKARIREEKSNLSKNEIPLNASLSLNMDRNAGAPALFLETSNEHSVFVKRPMGLGILEK